MTAGLVSLAVAASLAASVAAFDALTPGWRPGMVASEIGVDAVYTDRDGKGVTVMTCSDVASVRLTTVSEPDYAAFDRIRAQCAAACETANADPARTTSRRQLVAIVRSIPLRALPKMLSRGLGDGAAAATLAARPLRLRLVSGGVVAQSETEEVKFTPLAYGDFDHNRVSDVLLRVEYSLRGGSYTATDLVAVSPPGKRRPSHVAWHWDRTVCGVGQASPKAGGV